MHVLSPLAYVWPMFGLLLTNIISPHCWPDTLFKGVTPLATYFIHPWPNIYTPVATSLAYILGHNLILGV